MKIQKPLYIAKHREVKAYFNPLKTRQNKLDYEIPKFFISLNSLVNGLRRLENSKDLKHWDIFEVEQKLTKIELCDIYNY